MPTIIDRLIVTLGIDKSGYDKDRADVDKGLKDTKKGFSDVALSAAKFLGVIGGTMAIKRFVSDMIESNAALDRFSKNLGESANTISAWSNAAEIAGGSAEGLQGSMDMLSRSQTELQLTGQSSLLPYFSSLGVAMADASGKARPVSDMLLDLAERFSHMDRTTANNMGRMMGLDQGTMNLLLKGRGEVELMIKRQKEYGAVTKEQAEEASKVREETVRLQQQITAFGRSLASVALPALEAFFGFLNDGFAWMREHKDFAQAFFGTLLIPLILRATAAMWGFTAALLANPLMWVTGLVVGLATAIRLLWEDYQVWRNGGKSLIDWDVWGKQLDAAINKISELVHQLKVLDGIINAMSKHRVFDRAFATITGNKMPDEVAKQALAPTPIGKAAAAGAQRQALDFFQRNGFSKEQSAGLVANLLTESGLRANAVGDSGKAYGIGQWHPDRQAAFERFAGKSIRGSSLDDQLRFVAYELTRGGERAAGDKLRRAATAQEAGAIVSQYYERPADRAGEASRRGQRAVALLGGIPGASSTTPRSGQGGAAPVSNSVETHIGEVRVYTAATDANGIASDMGKSLNYLFTSQANYGLN